MIPQSRALRRFIHPLLCTLLVSVNSVTFAQTPHPTFEVASVKQSAPDADPNTGNWSPPGKGKFKASHLTLTRLLQLAYGLDSSQIANKPAWLDTELYDVDAIPEEGVSLTREELKPRLQDLLQQRFHLVAHLEIRPSSGYALQVAKHGAHLIPIKADHFPGYRINVSPGEMRGANWSTEQLAKYLTPAAGFPVVDQTGLTGSYDIGFSYNPNPEVAGDLPSLTTALEQATGLMLKPQKVPVETLVIDSVGKIPATN